MILGIVSDPHDNLPKIMAAVNKSNSLGVGYVLNAGEYCAPFAALAYKIAKLIGVFCGHLSGKSTVATFDTNTRAPQILEI